MLDSRPEARRGFLKAVTGAVGGALAALAAVPGLGFLAHGLRRNTVDGVNQPIRVATSAEVRVGRPLRVSIVASVRDAWSRLDSTRIGAVWLVRGPAGDVRAFSTVCPHLGCGVDWSVTAQRFECPCHRSSFDGAGKRLDGPAPRGLDELEVVTTEEDIRVRYQRFRPGIERKEPVE